MSGHVEFDTEESALDWRKELAGVPLNGLSQLFGLRVLIPINRGSLSL
jgi:hypothetical protein